MVVDLRLMISDLKTSIADCTEGVPGECSLENPADGSVRD